MIDEKVPLMDPSSHEQLNLTSDKGADLEKFDVECGLKHLEAIKDNVTTHKELHGFTFMEGEQPMRELELAGLDNAPGLFDQVTQQCLVVFTNKNRLVFTQVRLYSRKTLYTPEYFVVGFFIACMSKEEQKIAAEGFFCDDRLRLVVPVFLRPTLHRSKNR